MKKLKILFLEDEIPYSDALRKNFAYLQIGEVEPVTELLDLDWCLYDNPDGIANYDFVLLDLRISEDDLESVLEEIPELNNAPKNVIAGISLLGLDYFQHKILTHPSTKDIALTKFALISGHKQLIKYEKLFSKNGICYPMDRLLDKGDYNNLSNMQGLVNDIKNLTLP
jgi:hypothetical protein